MVEESKSDAYEKIKFVVEDSENKERIDNLLAKKLGISRGIIQKLIEEGKVNVNGSSELKKSYRVKVGDEIEIEIPPRRKIRLFEKDKDDEKERFEAEISEIGLEGGRGEQGYVKEKGKGRTEQEDKEGKSREEWERGEEGKWKAEWEERERSKSVEDKVIEVIYEDDDYIVLNKPAGIVVHPSPHHIKDTLLSFILDKIKIKLEKSEFDIEELEKGKIRPGIIHRLDKPVSGVLIVAKNDFALWRASELFKRREVKKKYIALCFGFPGKDEWEISKPIKRAEGGSKVMRVARKGESGGKDAITRVKVLMKKRLEIREKRNLDICLLEVNPITGRTHQIRVHLSSEGFPIVKDEMYGGGGAKLEDLKEFLGDKLFDFDGIFLHAFSIVIFGKEFKAPLPRYFREVIKSIWGELPPTLF